MEEILYNRDEGGGSWVLRVQGLKVEDRGCIHACGSFIIQSDGDNDNLKGNR